jgi:hypothetical protein
LNEKSSPQRPPSSAVRRSIGILWCCAVLLPAYALYAASGVPKLAVFQFELQDESASASPSGDDSAELGALNSATAEAKKALAESGKYSLVDTGGAEGEAVKTRSLRNCDGCDAGIALRLGAEQSLVGVIVKVNQISYAVEIRIRDAATGKVLLARRGVLLGGPTEWSSGVRSVIKREVLTSQ